MRVFVAGATGAVGVPLVRQLVRAGHTVLGTTRTSERLKSLEELGAHAVLLDGLDRAAVVAAVGAARPEVVVHQMTDLRSMTDLRHFERGFARSNLLRTEGLDHLIDAAAEAGVRRIVVQSFCGWPYARDGAHVKSEGDPLDPSPPAELRSTLEAIRYLEHRTSTASMDGIVLRYGFFYGPGTGILSQNVLDQVSRRRFPLIGEAGGWWSFIHVEDAASATLGAIEHGSPGIYNIVDDEPAPVAQWLPTLAKLLKAAPPRHVARWFARIFVGDHVVSMMTEACAGSNAKAKRDLRWEPAFPSWQGGFAAALALQPDSKQSLKTPGADG